MIETEQLEKLNSQFRNDIAATYFISKYYFSVNTNKFRTDIGLLPKQEIDLLLQRKLQTQILHPCFMNTFITYMK